MSRLALLCAAGLLMHLMPSASAEVVSIPVAQDVTVNAANPDSNLNAITTRGGLLSGLDDTGSDYQFFLKFNLAGIDAELIRAAAVVGYYTDEFGPVDSFHQLSMYTDDSWSETDVTWNTRPINGSTRGEGFNAGSVNGPGGTVRFDVTEEVIGEASGDGVVTFGIATVDGRFADLEFFASREFDSSRAFRIDVTLIPLPNATPAAAVLIAGCAAVAVAGKRRNRASKP